MKKCQACQQDKPLEDFHLRAKSKDGRQSRCKICNKEQRKAYYKTAHGKMNNDTKGKRWAVAIRRRVFEYLLTHPCVDCGEADPVVLEFDHRDNKDKTGNICSMVGLVGWDKIEKEISKCDVRCANCHKRRTAEQFGWNKLAWTQHGPLVQ